MPNRLFQRLIMCNHSLLFSNSFHDFISKTLKFPNFRSIFLEIISMSLFQSKEERRRKKTHLAVSAIYFSLFQFIFPFPFLFLWHIPFLFSIPFDYIFCVLRFFHRYPLYYVFGFLFIMFLVFLFILIFCFLFGCQYVESNEGDPELLIHIPWADFHSSHNTTYFV